jgi:hypothetical protein
MSTNKQTIIALFDKVFSYKNGTVLKIKINVRGGFSEETDKIPHIIFCTVNDGALDAVCIFNHIYGIGNFKLKKDDITTFFGQTMLQFYYSTNPYKYYIYRIFGQSIIDKITIERYESTFSNESTFIAESETYERVIFKDHDITIQNKITIKINPYDYKNFEVTMNSEKFVGTDLVSLFII